MSTNGLAESLPQRDSPHQTGLPHETLWRPLLYFSYYRLTVAGFFFLAITVAGDALNLGDQNLALSQGVSILYLIAAVLLTLSVAYLPRAFNLQLSIQVAVDILALTLLMHSSGGIQSSVAVMPFVVLAGAGLVGQGRLTLFYASLATLAVLAEQAFRVLHFSSDPAAFFRTGLTSIGFFATAISARLLGRRVIAQEMLARQRGIELADQLRINERIIRDMLDGVLLVDADGIVGLHNRQAEILLDLQRPLVHGLASFSPMLSQHFEQWRSGTGPEEFEFRSPRSGRMLRAHCMPSGESGGVLIYLEDLGRVEAQARQLKLAALGRLTANMAHEIRNPLSAISHAAELLGEEARSDVEKRLSRIIGDNTQRLNRLVAEVMELGKRDKAKPELIRLPAFLHQFLDEYGIAEPDAGKRVSVMAATSLNVCFDRSHLHRVIWNLLANALRHASPADGAVRLEMRAGNSANCPELHIIDDGPGIEPRLRGQVFEPFFTTQSSGTGLGLYIARELCDANGAQLELLESEDGAHFRIVFSGGACPASPSAGNMSS